MSSKGQSEIFHMNNGVQIHARVFPNTKGPVFLWGHGWGQNSDAFIPLISSLQNLGTHVAFDFPGFGQSPEPPSPWSSHDYTDPILELIEKQKWKNIVWVGHSFGGRVGTILASRKPEQLRGCIMIAAAGLPAKKPFLKKISLWFRIKLYKFLKAVLPPSLRDGWLAHKFGSADYRKTSGCMRQSFIKIVNENLTNEALSIDCPTLYIYGDNDTETPPSSGERYAKLVKNSEFVSLSGHDHYSVLLSGKHQVANLIQKFISTKIKG